MPARSDTPNSTARDTEMRFRLAFLQPRYWLTWLGFGLMWLIVQLPRPVAVRLGNWLGAQHRQRNQKRAAIVDTNLKRCFPEKSAAERAQIAAEHYRYFGRSFFDIACLWWVPEWRLRKWIRFKGKQAYLDLLENHNVLLLLPHFNGLDLGGTYCSTLAPSMCMMKTERNALLNWQMWKGRSRFGDTRIIFREQGLRPYVKALKSGVACYYLADEDFGEGENTVFAPFFGIERATLTTLSGMARLGKAKVIGVIPRMTPEGGYEVAFTPPLENFPSGDEQKDAQAMNALLEAAIRQSPAQYMWTFRWFQTRPAGEPSFYDA